jgi:hypothetical protein
MTLRANWKGFLRLSLVTCPVALYPATIRVRKDQLQSTIRARFKSRCNVTGDRQRASSTLRFFPQKADFSCFGIIPTLNHDSHSGESGY